MTTTAPLQDTAQPGRVPRPYRVALAILALAVGGFTIGTTEFVTMGLLPEMARGIGVGIPQAGHVISAYALGVVVGAPLIAILGARLPRKGLLVALMAAYAVANLATALAPSFLTLAGARFVAGLPHGAYFGIASLVAAGLVDPDRKGRAVSRVLLGLAVANLVGVPAAAWLGQTFGWRSAYGTVTVLAVLTVLLVLCFVPATAPDREATGRRELLAFTRVQVWLTLLVGAVGFGGMFAMYSYISPTVTDVTGLSASAVPVYLLAFGVGGLLGTTLGGIGADWSVLRSIVFANVAMGAALVLFTATAAQPVAAWLTVLLVSTVGSMLAVTLQMRLMEVAGDARTIGAALNHASLNLANALGAWLGGVVIAAGLGYTAPSWVGAGLSLAGLVVLAVSVAVHRRDTRPAQAPQPAYSSTSRS
ncbi:MAG: transporter, family, inner rane transport protein [Nocardioidaceae bacterium]|nr:transporter, family, inner rane transport protein [Nocardioidaceae bacterium]